MSADQASWKPTEPLLTDALERAASLGASATEIFVQTAVSREIKVYQQAIEGFETAETRGIGVRVLTDGRFGYSYTAHPDQLYSSVDDAIGNAKVGSVDEYNQLPEPRPVPEIAGLYREELEETPVDSKMEIALASERAATESDPRVRGYATTYADEVEEVWLVNSHGISERYRQGYCYVYTNVVAEGESGEAQTGWSFSAGRTPAELDARDVGVEAAQRATSLLGAKKIESCSVPVLLQPMVASQFVGILSQALSGEAVQRGRSLFAGKLGEQVASDLLVLRDDGLRADGFATTPIDGEGVPAQSTPLIDNGVLLGFLYDQASALRDGTTSTGNGRRGSYKGIPSVSSTNMIIEPGAHTPDELVESMDRGLIVYEVSGVHAGANPVSGEISLGATGLWVEGGEIKHPVREITVGGHFLEMLGDIQALGSDFRMMPVGGSTGSPSVLISSMTVGGT